MSLAEAVPVVSETHQAMPSAALSGMEQPRRRVSADSFRNLTARLKSPVTIPSIAPVAIAPVGPEVGVPEAPASQSVATPVDSSSWPAPVWPDVAQKPVAVTSDPDPIAHEAPSLVEALNTLEAVVAEDKAIEVEAFEDAPPQSSHEVVATPDVEAPVLSEPLIEPPVITPPVLEQAAVLTKAFDDKRPETWPVEELTVNKGNVWENLAPKIESIAATPPPVIERSFPELVNPLEKMAAEEAARKAEEERLKAEAEARAAQQPPRDPEEEARRLAALAEAHVLENIWRQLLAVPSNEDKAAYLQEAREIMGEDALIPPAEEHDLSRIEPADEYVPEPASEEIEPQEAVAEAEAGEAVETTITILEQGGDADAAEFARSLLDMMAAGSSSGLPHERALAADTLLRLLPRLELKPLIMLSHRLAMMESPPHLLVAKLIRDPRVEVSGPLLEDCMHLTDRDILMVIEENKPDKLRMIARRRKLSRAISDALIATNDPSVMLTLVRNMEAEISHDGFNTLIEATDAHADLLAPLCTRTDLSAPFAFELFWHAPAQLRRYLLTRFLTDSETLSKILKITMATKDGEEASDIEPMSQHVILEALDRAARGKLEPACDEISAALQVNAKTVMRVLTDNQGEPLAILLKVASYPRSALPGLLQRLQEAELPLIAAERDLEELQALFDTLSFNKARILLTYWDWATTKTGPYAPVH